MNVRQRGPIFDKCDFREYKPKVMQFSSDVIPKIPLLPALRCRSGVLRDDDYLSQTTSYKWAKWARNRTASRKRKELKSDNYNIISFTSLKFTHFIYLCLPLIAHNNVIITFHLSPPFYPFLCTSSEGSLSKKRHILTLRESIEETLNVELPEGPVDLNTFSRKKICLILSRYSQTPEVVDGYTVVFDTANSIKKKTPHYSPHLSPRHLMNLLHLPNFLHLPSSPRDSRQGT